MKAASIAEEMIGTIDRLMDRKPLSGFDRGLVLSALKRACERAYIEGKTDEHAAWVDRQASQGRRTDG